MPQSPDAHILQGGSDVREGSDRQFTRGRGHPVFDTAFGYLRTAALRAAVDLDIFSIIGTGSATAQALELKTRASFRGLRILCDYLTVIGLLHKNGSSYSLTPTSRQYLDRTSPFCLASCVDFLAAPEMVSLALGDPSTYVRRGGSEGLTLIAPDNPVWLRFARSMVPFSGPAAKRLAAYVTTLPEPPSTILDVAAGHGFYGIEIARTAPHAVLTAIDWATVLALAQENAQRAGLTSRFRTIIGSAFDVDWGRGFDIIVLANLLHHFGEERCIDLLRRAKSSLSPTGQVLIVEFVPNRDRVSPPLEATFAFVMLATTPQGDAYTVDDLDRFARAAGFSGVAARPLSPTPLTLMVLQQS